VAGGAAPVRIGPAVLPCEPLDLPGEVDLQLLGVPGRDTLGEEHASRRVTEIVRAGPFAVRLAG
jgi:hypothetical protein